MPTPAERVASDPGLRRVLEVARSWGVSPSVFLGRRLVTVYERDPVGRAVRSVTESGWNDDDVDLALAFSDYEADACPGCGSQLAETSAAENEEMYDAKIAARCHKCTAIDIVQTVAQKKPHPSALLIGATLKTQGEQKDDPEIQT